jgi:hypothetical protein
MSAELDLQYAKLVVVTGRAEQKWRDVLTLPEPVRSEVLREWGEDDWVQDPDRFAQAVAIVNVIVSIVGTAAGAVSGVAGAGTAVAGLRAAL